MSVIRIEGLRKNYGRHVGIRDVSFSVEESEIFGFVGPNGAGKSTSIKVLLGFIFACGGSASVRGLDVVRDTRRIKAFTGYVPSDVRLYPGMRVGELLRRNAGFYGGGCGEETKRLCALFETDTGKRFGELSSGNKKKVAIICALMSRPKVVILDEPTNGLDPVMRKNLFEELKRQVAAGATVLMSSHDLSEVQEHCGRVAFIKNGGILTVADLKKAEGPQKILTVRGGGAEVPAGLALIKAEGGQRSFRTKLDSGAILAALMKLAPDDFTVENESMEARFWNLYGQEEKK